MGWSGGYRLMGQVIEAVKGHVPEASKPDVYRSLIAAFEDHDCDTLDDCRGVDPVYDNLMDDRYGIRTCRGCGERFCEEDGGSQDPKTKEWTCPECLPKGGEP
jgi:hypothetical protein